MIEKKHITATINQQISPNTYRLVRVRPYYNNSILVYLHSNTHHSYQLQRWVLSENYTITSVDKDYSDKYAQLMSSSPLTSSQPQCPDPEVEMLIFTPFDGHLQLDVSRDIAKTARAHGLKTVELYLKKATKEAYLNYMVCPKLKGNFYDGDASPKAIQTYDYDIFFHEIENHLKDQFRRQVTNIWVACQAFKNPMLRAVDQVAKSQFYAAGISDLAVGPSDLAGACAMKSAIQGQPLSSSFKKCVAEFDDDPNDQWGFILSGTDYFGF